MPNGAFFGSNIRLSNMALRTATGVSAGFPMSDDFSGAGTNSGTVGDDNWDARYTTSGNGTISIVSEELNVAAGSGDTYAITTNTITDGFSIQIDFDTVGSLVGTQGVRLFISGITAQWQAYNEGGLAMDWFLGSFNPVTYQSSGKWEVRRAPSSSTIGFYVDDVLQGSGSSGANVTQIQFGKFGGGSFTAQYDNFVVNDNANGDGTGIPIYLTP